MPAFRIYTEGSAVKPPGPHSGSGLMGASLEAPTHTWAASSATAVLGPGRVLCPLRSFLNVAFEHYTSTSLVSSLSWALIFGFLSLFFVCLFIHAYMHSFIHHSCSFTYSQNNKSLRGWSQIQTKVVWNPLLPAVGLWANYLTLSFLSEKMGMVLLLGLLRGLNK